MATTYTVAVTLYGNTRTWTGLTEAEAKRLMLQVAFKRDAAATVTRQEAGR